MSILRFDPFRESFRDLDRLTGQLMSGVRVPQSMPMDAWRSGDMYHVALDLPGVDPGTVDLTVERNGVTIRAERGPAFGQDDDVLVAERPQGQFTRQLVLGEGLDAEKVQADYSDGVLHLTIPVAQSAQPRKIEIGSRGQQQSVDVSGGQGQSVQGQSVDVTGSPTSAATDAGTTGAGTMS